MKTILATLVTVAFGLIALPEKAEARPHCGVGHSYTYASGHASCGCTVYKRRVIVGYDCYHRPIYRYYSVPIVHRCRSHYSSPYYRGHRHHRHYDRYYRGRYHRGHYGHSSISFRTRYGNVRICR